MSDEKVFEFEHNGAKLKAWIEADGFHFETGLFHHGKPVQSTLHYEQVVSVFRALIERAADYDALTARVVELENEQHESDIVLINTRNMAAEKFAQDKARIATLEASLAQKAAECEGDKMYIALARGIIQTILDTPSDCKEPHDIALHLHCIIHERDTALADLATAREECERLTDLLSRIVFERDTAIDIDLAEEARDLLGPYQGDGLDARSREF